MKTKNAAPPGYSVYHQSRCASQAARKCNCSPTWEAWVYSARQKKKLRKSFKSFAAAKSWRRDALVALGKHELLAPTPTTVRQAGDAWLEGATSGAILNRDLGPFKPSTIRSYRWSLMKHIYPELGSVRLSDLRRRDVQDLAERLIASGASPSTIRNGLMPLRVICGRAVDRNELASNPCDRIKLPIVRGGRELVVAPSSVPEYLAALTSSDRPLWATAFYAGLRCGELQAIGWNDLDFDAGLVYVKRAWDRAAGFIPPKSRAGVRDVPMVTALRTHLLEHRLASGRRSGLVFGGESGGPFDPHSARVRARKAWASAGLAPLTFHDARHCYSSYLIAAGENPLLIARYLGHASADLSFGRYGHALPGDNARSVARLDGYFGAGADTA